MKNVKIIFGIILLLLIGFGIYYFTSSRNAGQSMQDMGHNADDMQSHRSYAIQVTQKPNVASSNEPVTIKYQIKNDREEIIKDFAIVHERAMHFVVVRKDLANFQHLHPVKNEQTGEFSIDVSFPTDGEYRFYADFTPGEDDNPMKLPVTVFDDITVGNTVNYSPQALVADTNTNKTVNNYQITYSFPPEVKSEEEMTYSLTVTRNSEPVMLENYLGALGHSVMIKEGSLDYIHTHAGEPNGTAGHEEHRMGSTSSNMMRFTTNNLPGAGKYKIFTQFQHQGKVQVTEYTVNVN